MVATGSGLSIDIRLQLLVPAASNRKNGGASRDRTDDLIVANDALSQLSYSPTRGWEDFIIANNLSGFRRAQNREGHDFSRPD